MHRPGIASVAGDEIWLNGTTIDEVEQYHLKTLQLAIDVTNQQVAEVEGLEKAKTEHRTEAEAAHRQHVRDVAERLEAG